MAENAKYLEVINWINENIKEGTWKEGSRLPSEKDLCLQFGLSRQTIRHALDVLEKNGSVTKIQGSGTYVGRPAGKAVVGTAWRRGNTGPARPKYRNIAVISTYYDYYIFPPTLHGIETVMSHAGYTTMLSFTNDSVHHEQTILKGLIERDDIDGIIVEPAKSALPNPNLHFYRELQNRNIPILFFNACYQGLDLPCVRIDDQRIARKAAELLISRGHTQIAAVMNAEDGQGHLRYAGYLEAMWSHHIRTDTGRILLLDSNMIRNMRCVKDYLLRALKGVTGAVCYNDDAAWQIMTLLKEEGMRVPQDISLVGIDDSDIARAEGITSFPHPKEALGKVAAMNLLRMMEDPSFDGNYLFDAEPICRESVLTL